MRRAAARAMLPGRLGRGLENLDSEEDFKLKWDSGEIESGNVRELREFKEKLQSLKN